MTVFKGVYGLQNPTYVLCRKFFKSLLFFGRGNMGDVLPKIGEPSLATEGYEHKLWGMNVSKRLATYGLQTLTYNL